MRNTPIKTNIEEYPSAFFSEHPLGKLESLYFNLVDKIRDRQSIQLSNTHRRIVKEIEDLIKIPLENNFFIVPSIYDIRVWTAVIVGAPETIYHGGIFYISIEMPQDYPFKPPKMVFLNKIFHPQVFESGKICLNVLGEFFSPALTVQKITLRICNCLQEPETYDFIECPAKELFVKKGNVKEAALEYVEKFA